MKLNKNSVTSRLYKWFYGVSEYKGLPNNLCPYFWKVVLMYITIIPYTLFSIPVVVYDLFDKQYENGDRSTGQRLGVSFGVYFGLLLLTGVITSIAGLFVKIEPKSFWEFCQFLGCMIWAIAIIVGTIEGVKYLREWSTRDDGYYDTTQDKWITKKTKVNMTAEFIKAKYNKYCPKIDWVGNERED
jgi:hypothetical protein